MASWEQDTGLWGVFDEDMRDRCPKRKGERMEPYIENGS